MSRPPPAPSVPQGSPYKSNADGRDRFGHTRHLAQKLRENHCDEMKGLFLGPLEPLEFINIFTPLNNKKGLPPRPKVKFDKVPTQDSQGLTEKYMYPALIEAFARLTPGFEWFQSSDKTSSGDTRLRPDIGFIEAGRWADANSSSTDLAKKSNPGTFKSAATAAKEFFFSKLPGWKQPPDPEERPFDWKRCEFGVEVKRSNRDDAFVDDDPISVESSRTSASSRRGQLISYVKEQMSRQHRTSMHIVYIFGDFARLLYYDRAGSAVTKKFNYREEPELLAEFFWRYSHLSQAARGWDPTVSAATDREVKLFEEKVEEFVERCGKDPERDLSRLNCAQFAVSLHSDYPTFKVAVDSPKYSDTLIIRRPFFEPFSPVGRATRGYVAYSMAKNEVLFMKDTWRTDYTGRMTEAEVYKHLEAEEVPNLPTILYAADVQGEDGKVQRTRVNELSDSKKDSIRPFREDIRAHVHCRIVQRIAFPLSSFRDSKELVRVLRDALLAIKLAYDADVLHRDISLGNVMIAEDGSGILNDWDHSRKLPTDTPSKPQGTTSQSTTAFVFRTGTWQFMSIHVLQNPNRRHTILDDIESIYWLLLYCALHWLPYNDFWVPMKMFDEADVQDPTKGAASIVKGGMKKKLFLIDGDFDQLQFDSNPLNDLLHELGEAFYTIYWSEKAIDSKTRENGEAVAKNLQGITAVVDMFDEALRRTDWPQEADRVGDQFPPKNPNEDSRDNHRSSVELFASTSGVPPSPSTNRSRTTRTRSVSNRPNGPAPTRGSHSHPEPMHITVRKRAAMASTSSESGIIVEHDLYTPQPVAGPSRTPPSPTSTATHVPVAGPSSSQGSSKRPRSSEDGLRSRSNKRSRK